VVDIKVTGKTE
jgi:hypothetical protein